MQKYLRESNHLSNICNPTGKIIRPEMKGSLLSSCHRGPRDVIARGNSYLFLCFNHINRCDLAYLRLFWFVSTDS